MSHVSFTLELQESIISIVKGSGDLVYRKDSLAQSICDKINGLVLVRDGSALIPRGIVKSGVVGYKSKIEKVGRGLELATVCCIRNRFRRGFVGADHDCVVVS